MTEYTGSASFAERRKKGDEKQLTDEIGVLCAQDPVLARGVAQAVVTVAAAGRPRSLRDLVDRVPDSIILGNEVKIGPKRVRRVLPSTGGQLDWEFTGAGFCLVVEVKIGAPVGEGQLERYLRHKGIRSRATVGGLVLLTRNRSPIPRKVAKNKHWLGQVSWRELLPELEKIAPADPEVRSQWATVLEVIQRPGDLVADGVIWPLKGRTAGQRNRTILAAARDGACHFVELALTDWLGGQPEGRCAAHPPGHRHDVTYRGDRASLGLYVPARTPKPVVTIELWGTRQPLKVAITLHLDQLRTGRLTQRAQCLRGQNFTRSGAKFVATNSIRQGPDKVTPQQALQEVLEVRLGQIIECGALDLRV